MSERECLPAICMHAGRARAYMQSRPVNPNSRVEELANEWLRMVGFVNSHKLGSPRNVSEKGGMNRRGTLIQRTITSRFPHYVLYSCISTCQGDAHEASFDTYRVFSIMLRENCIGRAVISALAGYAQHALFYNE